MPTGRLIAVVALFVTAQAVAAQPENLLRNPRFNRDLADWTPLAGGSTVATYDASFDRNGAADSGSARVKVVAASPFSLAGITSECFPVTAGHYYQWSTDVFIPSGQVAGSVQNGFRFSTDPLCLTLDPATYSIDNTSATGVWTRLSATAQVPPGMVAGRLFIGPIKTAVGGDLVTYADEAAVVEVGCEGRDPLTTLCLQNGRFAVTSEWGTPTGASGQGMAVQLTDDTGYFWFFSLTNVEVVVKVLNACTPFQRYWAFSAGLTNVQVDLAVEDTQTGAVRTYFNPLNTSYPPTLDTDAFATCP